MDTVTEDQIMKMGLDARIQTETFYVDTFDTLIKKYEQIRDSNEYLEDSIKKMLTEQISQAVKTREKVSAQLTVMKLFSEVFVEKDKLK